MADLYIRVTYSEGNPPKSFDGEQQVYLKNSGGEYIMFIPDAIAIQSVVDSINADSNATIITESAYNTDVADTDNFTKNT